MASFAFVSACSLTNIYIHPNDKDSAPTAVNEPSRPVSSNLFVGYSGWFEKNKQQIPTLKEREILSSYLKYLEHPDAKTGSQVVKKMKSLAKDKKHKISSRWVSFFDSIPELTNNGYSLGVASGERFFPLIEKGDKTALEILILYSACVKTEGSDAIALSEYENIAKEKHLGAIQKIHQEAKNQKFLSEYTTRL